MFALFSKYLLIGLSAMILLAGAQQGLFSPQSAGFVLADCEQEGGCPEIPPVVEAPQCPAMTCEYSEPASDCPSGSRIVSGTGASGFNQPGCTYVASCSQTRCSEPSAPSVPEQPAPPTTPVCNLPPQERYPECAPDCTNGGKQAATTWAMVTRNVDYNSCSITSYICDSIEYNSSQCGYFSPPQQPEQPSQPEQPVQPAQPEQPAQRAGACYLCDGTTRRLVSGDGGNFTSENDCRNSGEGNRSFDSNPAICAPTQAQTCQSNGSCSVSTPAVCGQTATGIDNCGRSCSRSSAACVIPPTPPQGGNTTVNPVITVNPIISNTNTNTSANANSNTNTVTNNITREIIRQVSAPATFGNVGVGNSVVYTQPVQYTALPKTGLPELAWSALAFIPTGFGLRRFAKVKKALENHPSYIWEERQFKA